MLNGIDDCEVWSSEGSYKVLNIDETSPVISILADTSKIQQKVETTINVIDDKQVAIVKWAVGIQGETYFSTNGTEVLNDSIVEIIENGYYTFYAEDKVGNKQVYTLNVTNIDKTAPENPLISASTTEWTNSNITVTINYTSDSVTREYSFDDIIWNNYTSSLVVTDNNTTIYARSKDEAGNQSGQSTLTITNIDKVAPENPIIEASPSTWTNDNVTVTINYLPDSVVKEYSLDGINWNIYNFPLVVSENDITIYAITKDRVGNQSGQSTLTVTNIDRLSPTVTFGTNGAISNIANTSVTITDTGVSGLNSSTLQYVWDTQNITLPNSGWSIFTNSSILTKGNVDGTYYLWIKVSDNAGNCLVSKSNAFILTQSVEVNKPLLVDGMTAKIWNSTTNTWDTVSNPDSSTTWYNYMNKEWANAQTTDGSMWVWIPRYEYKIPALHSSTAQEISINFLLGTPTTSTEGYTVHPAFTFGITQLTGIWVAKFEASGVTSAVTIKPDVISLRNITVGTMFTACRNMEINNIYGWGTSGIGVDTHLSKNIEWGAVAYLSQSIYGKKSEIWINPDSTYKTGRAGTSVSATSTTSTYSYNNTTYGVNASTTGNIYGIYDMSGGASEYVSGYNNVYTDGNFSSWIGTSLYNADIKYKDTYVSYASCSTKKGDAVYETSSYNSDSQGTSWYKDYSYMYNNTTGPYYLQYLCARGGSYSNGTFAGIFAFSSGSGGTANINGGFRPVIAINSEL